MSNKSTPPFTLPAEPCDRYQVTWFRAYYDGYNNHLPPRIEHFRAVYHANTKWKDIDERSGGADFVDQWQIFANGAFSGRSNPGWAAFTKGIYNWSECFATQAEAEAYLIERMREETAYLQNKLNERLAQLETLTSGKFQRDACEECRGAKGGVPGNENIVNGRTLCDYCSV